MSVNGKVVWTNRDYPFYGQHGLGTSLVLYRDLLIMARDGSSEGDDKALGWQTPWDQSFIIALDAQDGPSSGGRPVAACRASRTSRPSSRVSPRAMC